MKLKRIVSMLILCAAALAVSLACSVSTNLPFVSKAEPTSTRRPTRVARATFTPLPAATEIPTLEPTEEPTQPPEPTQEPPTQAPPTKKPAVKATKPPQPTAPPQPTPPPQPAATEAPKYPYKASIVTCTHAGNAYIKGSVCNDNKCNSKLSGMIVVMSDAPHGTILDKVKTDVSGDFTFTRSGSGPVNNESWYFWVVNAQDQPLSDAGGPVQLDMGHNEDNLINKCPNTAAFISFFKP
ncbi:hypothetical protein FBQ82_06600 [Anaerolineae bacterium CFX7]|nr:hypothetical protein [Anaerolineae bacterium CFX7]